MKPFTNFSSRMVVLPVNNIDTDQIIPARFLKITTKEGLDKHLFQDWRYDESGQPKPDFVLNQPLCGLRDDLRHRFPDDLIAEAQQDA